MADEKPCVLILGGKLCLLAPPPPIMQTFFTHFSQFNLCYEIVASRLHLGRGQGGRYFWEIHGQNLRVLLGFGPFC